MCDQLMINVSPRINVVPDLAGFMNSSPARSVENLVSDRRTIHLMKLLASTMLSHVLTRQYSSVLPLLCHCLQVKTSF